MSENTFSQPYPAINSHVLKLLPVKTVLNVILLRSVLDALSIRARLKLKTDRPRSTQIYWVRLKGSYMVARIFFLLLLNCSAWPCLGPA